ncbi:hypothetical protein KC853_01340, partial [Candidatus Saccharibacteria bacterium]|nr:hypothetical protein [Candidatus Saccharibacteria bacterium]
MGLIEMNSNPGDNFNRHLRNIEEEVDGFTVTKLYFLGCEDPEKFLVEILFERLSVECGPFIIIKPDLYDLKDESLAGACFLDQV